MPLDKPAGVAADPFKSAKWDELTDGREFSRSDAPTLELLVQWHAVVQRCIDDMDDIFRGQVAYTNDMGDIKAIPQIETMKKASAEVRQLNRQLGIVDTARSEQKRAEVTPLELIRGKYKGRGAASTG